MRVCVCVCVCHSQVSSSAVSGERVPGRRLQSDGHHHRERRRSGWRNVRLLQCLSSRWRSDHVTDSVCVCVQDLLVRVSVGSRSAAGGRSSSAARVTQGETLRSSSSSSSAARHHYPAVRA